jgi:CBS domain-containing protein
MTSLAVTIRAEATTEEAARLMYRYRIASLPVVDSLGRLIGIISQGDVLDSFTRQDAQIRREVVRGVISRDFLLRSHAFSAVRGDPLPAGAQIQVGRNQPSGTMSR